jgi:hypothetical protein
VRGNRSVNSELLLADWTAELLDTREPLCEQGAINVGVGSSDNPPLKLELVDLANRSLW